MGFTHSLYIDPDVLNVKKIPNILGGVEGVAIAPRNFNGTRKTRLWLGQLQGGQIKSIDKVFGVKNGIKRKSIGGNTGVVAFNNRYVDFYMADKINAYWKTSKRTGIPRKGDDSLFALFDYLHNSAYVKLLPVEWNFLEIYRSAPKDVINIHFIRNKPWSKKYWSARRSDHRYKSIINKWQKHEKLVRTYVGHHKKNPFLKKHDNLNKG
jgi:hypothetical protein